MTRRAALLLPAVLMADERSDVIDAVTPLASALSNGDAEDFMRRISESAPDREALRNNIHALLGQAEITCSVRLVNIDNGRAELDWLMDIRSRATQNLLERRKGAVAVRIRNREILSVEPAAFFRPAVIR